MYLSPIKIYACNSMLFSFTYFKKKKINKKPQMKILLPGVVGRKKQKYFSTWNRNYFVNMNIVFEIQFSRY